MTKDKNNDETLEEIRDKISILEDYQSKYNFIINKLNQHETQFSLLTKELTDVNDLMDKTKEFLLPFK